MALGRMTTRRWAAVVLLAGTLAGMVDHLRRVIDRRMEYQSRARMHRFMSIRYDDVYDLDQWSSPEALRFREYQHRMLRYHAQLTRKYELAASRPWLSVEPDPPPPAPE
jgi:hypothetical protein